MSETLLSRAWPQMSSSSAGAYCDLEAREEIRQLTAEYMQAMHDARWEDAVACFAADASYDHGILGELRSKEDIRQFYTEFMPRLRRGRGLVLRRAGRSHHSTWTATGPRGAGSSSPC